MDFSGINHMNRIAVEKSTVWARKFCLGGFFASIFKFALGKNFLVFIIAQRGNFL